MTETPLRDSLIAMPVAPVPASAAAGMAIGSELDDRYGMSDWLAGVEGTSETRAAPQFYGDMDPFERQMKMTMDQLFGD